MQTPEIIKARLLRNGPLESSDLKVLLQYIFMKVDALEERVNTCEKCTSEQIDCPGNKRSPGRPKKQDANA